MSAGFGRSGRSGRRPRIVQAGLVGLGGTARRGAGTTYERSRRCSTSGTGLGGPTRVQAAARLRVRWARVPAELRHPEPDGLATRSCPARRRPQRAAPHLGQVAERDVVRAQAVWCRPAGGVRVVRPDVEQIRVSAGRLGAGPAHMQSSVRMNSSGDVPSRNRCRRAVRAPARPRSRRCPRRRRCTAVRHALTIARYHPAETSRPSTICGVEVEAEVRLVPDLPVPDSRQIARTSR